MNFLANENFPREAVDGLRADGHDVVWVRTEDPGIEDDAVLARAQAESRVLLTFDKDFGELAFRAGLPSGSGIVLFRLPPLSAAQMAERVRAVIAARTDWTGNFAVATDRRVRLRPLPGTTP